MKLNLVFLAVVGLSYATDLSRVRPTRDIHSDIQDFINLIPTQEILALVFVQVAADNEVQEAYAYFQSDEFRTTFQAAENQSAAKALLDDLESYGLYAYQALNAFNEIIGIDQISPNAGRQARSVKDLIQEIITVLPLDEIKALYDEKMKSSSEFKTVMDHLQSSEFTTLVDNVRATSEVMTLEAKLGEYNISVDEIFNFVKKLLGWTS